MLLAQKVNIGGQEFQGPLQGPGGAPINSLADVVNVLTTFLIPIAAVILLFVFIAGGYDLLLSQGDAAKVKSAKAKLTSGVIGFVLLLSSYFIAKLLASIFGLGAETL